MVGFRLLFFTLAAACFFSGGLPLTVLGFLFFVLATLNL